MVREMAKGLSTPDAAALALLLRPRLTDTVLRLAGAHGADLEPLFRNTVAPTIVRAGDAWNVLPTSASVELDGRLLPGHEPEQLLAELKALLPADAQLEVVRVDPASTRAMPDLHLLPLLAAVLEEEDAGGHPFPLVTAGMTDARHYDQLGIQTYGFLPLQLPSGRLPALLHAPDERVPAAALSAGTAMLERVISRYVG